MRPLLSGGSTMVTGSAGSWALDLPKRLGGGVVRTTACGCRARRGRSFHPPDRACKTWTRLSGRSVSQGRAGPAAWPSMKTTTLTRRWPAHRRCSAQQRLPSKAASSTRATSWLGVSSTGVLTKRCNCRGELDVGHVPVRGSQRPREADGRGLPRRMEDGLGGRLKVLQRPPST